LAQELKSEIRKNSIVLDRDPSIVIRLEEEYMGIIYRVNKTPVNNGAYLTEIYKGQLENINFSNYVSMKFSAPRLPSTNSVVDIVPLWRMLLNDLEKMKFS
jgi:hypothetical protein